MEMERQHFYQKAIHDPLTHLYSRIYMSEAVDRLLHIHDRDCSSAVSLMILDIDDFKSVNDTFGHKYGDDVLRKIADLIRMATRAGDIQVRLGGEEFAVFIVSANSDLIRIIAERIRGLVETEHWQPPLQDLKVTISAGIANRNNGEDLRTLLHRTDLALYKAKEHGKNQVQWAGNHS